MFKGQVRAKWPKVGPRSPIRIQNGGPGLPRNRTRTQSPKKRAQCAIHILFIRFQAHRTYSKNSLFHSGGHPKMKEKSGLRPRSPKNIAKVMQRAPKGSHRDAHGGPRVTQGLQNSSNILAKFLKKRGHCPGAIQKGDKRIPGNHRKHQ